MSILPAIDCELELSNAVGTPALPVLRSVLDGGVVPVKDFGIRPVRIFGMVILWESALVKGN